MALKTCSICNDNSRDGATIKACTPFFSVDKLVSIGIKKESVLPEPVGAITMIFLLVSAFSMTSVCISLNIVIDRLANVFS